jgi:hypothetical protein
MSQLSGAGIRVEILPGWEGALQAATSLPDGAVRPTVIHLGNFPLPAKRGDFGSGAVERMRGGDVLIVLFEYGRESAGTALFSASIPREIVAADFDRNLLQRRLPNQSGCQKFFTHSGRAFSLYVVVASHIDRADALPSVNRVLAGLEVDP